MSEASKTEQATAKPTKSIEKLQLELKQTLDSLGCIEVVQSSSRGGDIRALCRCEDKPAWLMILFQFLEREVGQGWYSFIGQKYMIIDGNLTAAWVLIFEAKELDAAVQNIRKMFVDIKADIATSTSKTTTASGKTQEAAWSSPVTGFGGKYGALVGAQGTRGRE